MSSEQGGKIKDFSFTETIFFRKEKVGKYVKASVNSS